MIITYFRSSSFTRWDFCQQLFFIEYVLGWSGPDSRAATRGTMVHKVLEILANVKLAHQNDTTYVDDICDDISLDMSVDIDLITEKVFGYYAKHTSHIAWEDKDYKDTRKLVYKAIEFNDGMFDPRNKDIIDVEKRFDFEIEEPWALYKFEHDGEMIEGFLSLKGTIDQINKIDDDTLEILDWKTGARKDWATGEEKTHEKLREDVQLRMYHYAATKVYPEYKNIMCTIDYIKDGGPFTICFDESDIEQTKEIIRKRFEIIKKSCSPKRIWEDNTKDRWKCKRLCHASKLTFKGTSIQPLVQTEPGNLSKVGETMCMCDQVLYSLKHRDISTITKHMMNPEHTIGSYAAPGEVG